MKARTGAILAMGALLLVCAWWFRPRSREAEPVPVQAIREAGPVAAVPRDPPPERQVENVMDAWRSAILHREGPRVLEAERILRAQPALYRPRLMKLADADPEPQVRAFSTRVLGKMKAPECGELLVRLLRTDGDRNVRENAAWSLGEVRAPGAAEALDLARKADGDEKVRAAAAAALERVR